MRFKLLMILKLRKAWCFCG